MCHARLQTLILNVVSTFTYSSDFPAGYYFIHGYTSDYVISLFICTTTRSPPPYRGVGDGGLGGGDVE